METVFKMIRLLNENPLKVGGVILVMLFILWIIFGDIFGIINFEGER